MDSRFKLLLSSILFISTFKFKDIIGVGVCFCHSDNTVIRKRERTQGRGAIIMEV